METEEQHVQVDSRVILIIQTDSVIVQSQVSGPVSSRIGVYLDHSAGVLSFYSVSESTMSLLHREQTTFTKPLYTGVYIGQKSDDPLSPDYVPSVFVHTKSPAKRRALGTLQKYKVRQQIKKKKGSSQSRDEAARVLSVSQHLSQLRLKI
ncbi:hypothetical protein WMY93_020903 [Mugilogobius chulae]|uniref:B30.2/SPRY domain-containing protein n=1 Tax=Mugilogobius chulae TaxID=88201 RepID=A0AAW0NLD9_9GOBI